MKDGFMKESSHGSKFRVYAVKEETSNRATKNRNQEQDECYISFLLSH